VDKLVREDLNALETNIGLGEILHWYKTIKNNKGKPFKASEALND